MSAVSSLVAQIGHKAACEVLAVPRASFYRRRQQAGPKAQPRPRGASPQGLSAAERQRVLDTLNCERFLDEAPAQIHARQLAQAVYCVTCHQATRASFPGKSLQAKPRPVGGYSWRSAPIGFTFMARRAGT